MMKRRGFGALFGGLTLLPWLASRAEAKTAKHDAASKWLEHLERMAGPLLAAFAAGKLAEQMPMEAMKGEEKQRELFSPTEAICRLLYGIGPWLALATGDAHGAALQTKYRALVKKGFEVELGKVDRGVFAFDKGKQALVEAAFLAQTDRKSTRLNSSHVD